jgi:hypothetical protein
MRERFVFRNGGLVPWAEASRIQNAEDRRSGLPCPSIIRDGLDGLMSHVDGKRYDSKSAYYRSVKAAGCEIVGNEAPTTTVEGNKRPVSRDDVEQAIAKLEQGYKP